LENELGVEITKTSTPDGRDISEYEVDCYTYNLLNDSYANKWITANSEEYKVLFGEDGLSFYWLASKCVDLRIQNDMARYDMRLVREGAVDIKILMASNGNGVGGGYPVYPIVTLNSGLEVEGGTGEKGNPWTIKIVNE